MTRRLAWIALACCLGGSARAQTRAESDAADTLRRCGITRDTGELPGHYAVRCAEKFVVEQGYTSLNENPDTAFIVAEGLEWGPTKRDWLNLRRNTLNPNAAGVCVRTDGFDVAFRYSKRGGARGVSMDTAFGSLRMQHEDFHIDAVTSWQNGCRPIVPEVYPQPLHPKNPTHDLGRIPEAKELVASWVGCYAVASSRPFKSGEPMLDSFRLAATPVTDLGFMMSSIMGSFGKPPIAGPNGFAIYVHYPPVRRLSNAPLGWTLLGSDSIVARIWSDGFVQISMELGRHQGALSGTAVVSTDVMTFADSLEIAARTVPCPSSAMLWPANQPLTPLGDSDLVVAGVHLGMSRSEVDSVLRPPLGVVTRRAPMGLRVEYDSTGHSNRIVLTSPRVATARGLRVGDPVARFREFYGLRGLSVTTKDSTTIIGLPREDEWVGITVIIHGGRVTEIDVGPVTSYD